MKTCRMIGSTSLVRGDSPLLSVGTSRQPRRIWPSPLTARSISCSHAMRDAGSLGRKTIPTPYWPTAGKRQPLRPAGLAQEHVRQLDQDAGAVALQRIGARRAAMRQVLEDRERLRDDRVRLLALDVRDEPEAARIVLVRRVIKTLAARHGIPLPRETLIHDDLTLDLWAAAGAHKGAPDPISPNAGETYEYYLRCCDAARCPGSYMGWGATPPARRSFGWEQNTCAMGSLRL